MVKKQFIPSDKFLFGLVLSVLTFWLCSLSLTAIVPNLVNDTSFHVSSDTISIGLGLTALFSGCFIVVAGGLGDRFGRLKMTYLGLALNILGCVCLIFTEGAILFLLGRVLQGLSAACILSSTLALVKSYYAGAARQRALSFWSIGSWGGGGLYSFFGNTVSQEWGWRTIFVISIVITAVAILFLLGTPDSKVERKQGEKFRFDMSGLIFFVVTLLALNIFIANGKSTGWMSALTIGSISIAVIAFIIFYFTEKKKGNDAFINFSLFKSKGFNGATISNFYLNSVAGTLAITPIYLQSGLGFTATQYGILTLGYAFSVLAMIRVGEFLERKIGAKKPMIIGIAINMLGIAMMTLTFLPVKMYTISVMIGFLLFGLGLGFYATPATDTAISNTPDALAGTASGIFKMASSLGNSFGNTITLTVYFALLSTTHTFENIRFATTTALFVNIGLGLLALLSVIFIVPKHAGKSS